jgi:MFS family permease
MVLVAFADLTWLLVGAAWAGLSFGAFWSLGPALVADRFGERAFAPVYALSSIATGLASYLLSTLLTAGLYQRHLDAAAAEGTVCLGQACFRDAFLTIAGIAVLAALLASFFSRKLQSLYRGPQGRALRYDAFVSSYQPWRCGQRLDASCARARRSK